MTEQTKTTEQIAAEAAEAQRKAAEAKEAERKAKAAQKEKEKAEAKAKREAEAAAKKKAREDEKAAKKKEREDAKAAKQKAKDDAKAAKEAAKQPEQNGIRRPGPDGKCGKAWALMDTMSAQQGSPVAISDLLVASNAMGMNPNMVRSNYAAWRKFNGVTGRVLSLADIEKAKQAMAAQTAGTAQTAAA